MNEKMLSMDFVLKTMSGKVLYWKDKKGRYLEINDAFGSSFDLSFDEVITKTDLDLPWTQQAPTLIENDKRVVFTDNTQTYIETLNLKGGGVTQYLSHKTPLYSQTNTKKIIGVFGVSCPAPSICLQSLTSRQESCLFYLVKGLTVKQIAKILDLSPRTIEHYFEAIRKKLRCSSRSELIEQALQRQSIQARLVN